MNTFSSDSYNLSSSGSIQSNPNFHILEPFSNLEKDNTTAVSQFNNDSEFKKRNNIADIQITKNVTVFDVSAYIIKKLGPISSMKLQKLTYYSQAWSLVWDEKPLFSEKIEAWANGPVIPDLFSYHRGQFSVSEILIGNIDNLNDNQKETINAVLNFYGDKPAQWLIDLSHSEKPWQIARKGLAENEAGNREISIESMVDYYSSISN